MSRLLRRFDDEWSRRSLAGVAVVLGFLLVVSQPCQAQQSFLEKLEQAVKKQVPNEPARKAPSDDTLPPPKVEKPKNKLVVPPPATVPPVPERKPNAAPSASNALPPVVQPQSQAPSPAGAGNIYLGLEAEGTVGGGIGVQVVAVTAQSPAWKAGFEIDDKILAVNGYGIAKLQDMVEQLSKTSPGQTVDFLISRKGRNKELKAVLMDADLASRTVGGPPPSQIAGPPYLGVMVNDLTTSFRRQFGLNVFRGAAVSKVTAGSPAQRAGIQAGDAIIEAGGFAIESADALLAWLSQTRPGQEVNLTVYRGPIARNVELIIGLTPRSGSPAPRAPIARDTSEPQGSYSSNRVATGAEPANANSPELAQLRGMVEKLETENSTLKQQLKETEAKLDQIIRLLKDK